MSEQKPSIGRIVVYRLSADDATTINRRRTDGNSIKSRMEQAPPTWPAGAQAHIGNVVSEGQKVPMMIVAVWSDTCVNGQAFLDGNDTLWVLSANPGDEPRQWNWPPRA